MKDSLHLLALVVLGLLMPSLCAYASPLPDAKDGKLASSWQNVRTKSGETIDTIAFRVHYRVGKSNIDPDFSDNAAVLADLQQFLDKMKQDTLRTIRAMELCGSVSPEGPRKVNERLVVERAASLRRLIREDLEIDAATDCVSLPSNIREVDAMITESKVSKQEAYSQMRHATVNFVIDTDIWTEYRVLKLDALEPEMPGLYQAPAPMPLITYVWDNNLGRTVVSENGRLHLKTNLLAWGLLVSNVAVEWDFANRWSFTLPVYYSALNYFKQKIKFRTTNLQPEFRFWFADYDRPNRAFIGAHMGIGWFNVAINGDYRYQDVGGHTPALGGGISAGYRITLPGDKRGRWKMEFTLGAGIYKARYDKFENYYNGPYVARDLKYTFIGIDNAAVTIIYTFPVKY